MNNLAIYSASYFDIPSNSLLHPCHTACCSLSGLCPLSPLGLCPSCPQSQQSTSAISLYLKNSSFRGPFRHDLSCVWSLLWHSKAGISAPLVSSFNQHLPHCVAPYYLSVFPTRQITCWEQRLILVLITASAPKAAPSTQQAFEKYFCINHLTRETCTKKRFVA